MGEFASKGVAGSGLGLGIAGTALGLLNATGTVAAFSAVCWAAVVRTLSLARRLTLSPKRTQRSRN
jgi:hypothetical protein